MPAESVRLERRLFCATYATVYLKDEMALQREATTHLA
jgi:hypothetical protein